MPPVTAGSPGPSRASLRVYAGLVATLTVSAVLFALLPSGGFAAGVELPAPAPVLAAVNGLVMLVLYGGAGFLGLHLAARNGFPEVCNDRIRQRVVRLSLVGCGVGVVFVAADLVRRATGAAALPHPGFPASVLAAVDAGIGEEILFRLLLVSFWLWAFSRVVRTERGRARVFWVVAVLCALGFAAAHLPSLLFLYGVTDPLSLPAGLLGMVVGLNGLLGLVAAWAFRRYGFLAAVLVHFWCDVVWHVCYGAFIR